MTDLELLSIGDATLDVFLTPTESESLCTLNNKECLICFSYGEKIPVKTIEYSVGGNAANNAVGAARLGVKAGIVTTLGGDSPVLIFQQSLTTAANEPYSLTTHPDPMNFQSTFLLLLGFI